MSLVYWKTWCECSVINLHSTMVILTSSLFLRLRRRLSQINSLFQFVLANRSIFFIISATEWCLHQRGGTLVMWASNLWWLEGAVPVLKGGGWAEGYLICVRLKVMTAISIVTDKWHPQFFLCWLPSINFPRLNKVLIALKKQSPPLMATLVPQSTVQYAEYLSLFFFCFALVSFPINPHLFLR